MCSSREFSQFAHKIFCLFQKILFSLDCPCPGQRSPRPEMQKWTKNHSFINYETNLIDNGYHKFWIWGIITCYMSGKFVNILNEKCFLCSCWCTTNALYGIFKSVPETCSHHSRAPYYRIVRLWIPIWNPFLENLSFWHAGRPQNGPSWRVLALERK